jgi:hypothetical protein
MDEDRASTLTVLMDVSAARRETDEKLAELGPMAAKPTDLPDGLKPHLMAFAAQSVNQLIMNPTWANTLFATTLGALATDPKREDPSVLRAYLVQVASTAVAWIEVLDERKSFK